MTSHYKAMKVNGVKVDVHRYVMEQAIGRKLSRNEIVHHINHDKHDNRLENLQIMSRAEHGRHHAPSTHSPEVRAKISARMKENPHGWRGALADETVREIRTKRAQGIGPCELARQYGINKSTVIDIVKGRRYARVV